MLVATFAAGLKREKDLENISPIRRERFINQTEAIPMVAPQTRPSSTPAPYAVIFRTHFWDDFAQRQFDRLLAKVGSGHVYVLVDETNGIVAGIRHDRILRVTEQDILTMGLPKAGTGNLLWFNGDYPLYYFLQQHGGYEYYLQLEYDVVVNTDIDTLIGRASADSVDFVGLTKGEPVHEWAWLHTTAGVYSTAEVRYKLICLSLFSHRAIEALAGRRLDMAGQLHRSEIANWPFCEGFIATEMEREGFVSVEWAAYVDMTAYDTWPPFVEGDLPVLACYPVIHPVLDQQRYIGSLLKYKVGLIGYINPNSLLHRKLRRLPLRAYASALTMSFWQKAVRTMRLHRVLPG